MLGERAARVRFNVNGVAHFRRDARRERDYSNGAEIGGQMQGSDVFRGKGTSAIGSNVRKVDVVIFYRIVAKRFGSARGWSNCSDKRCGQRKSDDRGAAKNAERRARERVSGLRIHFRL